jgi:hypothetical protein
MVLSYHVNNDEFITVHTALLDDTGPTPANADTIFFHKLRMANGVFRTTEAKRLDDVNALALPYIKKFSKPNILDIGASSGLTSLEWIKCLDAANVECTLCVTDLTIWALVVKFFGVTLLYQPVEPPHLLQVDFGTLACPNASGSRLRNQIYRLVRKTFPHSSLLNRAKRLMLIGPSIRRYAEKRNRLSFQDLDIMAPTVGNAKSFQVIRAANILNSAYFSHASLALALRNLFLMLDDDGVLVLTRTVDGVNNGAIYVRDGSAMKRVTQFGSGYEAESAMNVVQSNASG